MIDHIAHYGNLPALVGAERCLALLFPDPDSRPSLMAFREWQARGHFPYYKIGRRTIFDPEQVRSALDRRFQIRARDLR
jgi:hypothetical protein